MPPHATYLFKHALVQDAAYGTLLREPRRALHARIAETLENQFAEIAESQPELLARHYTEAGQIEKAAGLWGKAGQRSLERSALVEAVAQITHGLDQIATLPSTPALRRETEAGSAAACSCARFRLLDRRHAAPDADLTSPPLQFLTQFLQQSRVFDGYGGLVSERLDQSNLLLREWLHIQAVDHDDAPRRSSLLRMGTVRTVRNASTNFPP